jgi:hypothetical protein
MRAQTAPVMICKRENPPWMYFVGVMVIVHGGRITCQIKKPAGKQGEEPAGYLDRKRSKTCLNHALFL